ncbi:MAG: cytochrome c3 family protein, partial [Rhodospirillaceae bacterium]
MAVIVTFTGPGPQGQPLRERRSIEGSTLRVGRSTDCELVLPDARIALLRARIDIGETGATITAEGDPIEVNGRAQRSAALQTGDRLAIGPYSIEVEAPRPGVPLALTVQWHPDGDEARASRPAFRRGPPVSKRRLSYLAVAAIVLLFIVLPMAGRSGYDVQAPRHGAAEMTGYLVSAVGAAFVQSWNPGPVSRGHEAFGDDCGQCHGFPLVQVRDASCIACHKTITQHVRTAGLNGPMAADMRERRCAQCHLDHKGRQIVPRAQEECTSCHGNIGRYTAEAGAKDITDFAADHPRFRLALIDASKPEEIHRVRQGTPMTEHSNLKFNHALHVDPNGVRDPDGKRDARGMHNERGGRTVLQCHDCHQPAESGAGLQPISMDRHCRRCHSLAFEPKAMQRQVPHGSKEMETMLSEFYARLALRDAPPRTGDAAQIARTRPGATLTYEDRQRVI